jgi:hypothetical protein
VRNDSLAGKTIPTTLDPKTRPKDALVRNDPPAEKTTPGTVVPPPLPPGVIRDKVDYGTPPNAAEATMNRAAAEAVIRAGEAELTVCALSGGKGGAASGIGRLELLPAQPFWVIALALDGPGWTDEKLRCLEGHKLIGLEQMFLSDTKVTGDGFRYLSAGPRISTFAYTNGPLANEGLAHLAKQGNFVRLVLNNTSVTDEGLTALRPNHFMRILDLRTPGITSVGLQSLKKLGALQSLTLGAGINEDAVSVLSGMTSLRTLDLAATPMTHSSVEKLKQCLPMCQVVPSAVPKGSSGKARTEG